MHGLYIYLWLLTDSYYKSAETFLTFTLPELFMMSSQHSEDNFEGMTSLFVVENDSTGSVKVKRVISNYLSLIKAFQAYLDFFFKIPFIFKTVLSYILMSNLVCSNTIPYVRISLQMFRVCKHTILPVLL